MATINTADTSGTLTGLFKEVYAPNLKFLMPKSLKWQNDIAFVPADQQPGGYYNQPVVVQHEQGFKYAAGNADAFGVQTQVAGQIKNAQVVGAQILLQSALGYEAAARASSGGKRAFVAATKYLVENMYQSMKKRLEIEIGWGQSGLGTVNAVNTADITIDTAEWAPGIWAGQEQALVDFSEAAWASVHRATYITAVNIETKTFTVNTATSIVPTDLVSFKDQVAEDATPANVVFSQMAGMHKILTNAGTLFGISAATYSLWKANTQSAGSVTLDFETVQRLVAACVGKGAEDDMILYVNPVTWATMLADQAALRLHGDPNKSSRYTIGSENIEFYSQVGKVTIKPTIYMKEGFAFLINPSAWHRVGASEVSFRLRDRGDEYFFHLSDYAAYALRCYCNQAVFTETPGTAGYVSAIVNS
jgi:hypothetical protein